ncbi:MAG TPA: DAK2 domain-containing protein [Chloroflexia bacterium]|nr:DAK2 domain-containing protein [Chloroflexia bacterium]
MADLMEDPEVQTPTDTDGHWDGPQLKRAMHAASRWLERHAANINALNVFPVPDGDTGTNMTMTLQAACKHVGQTVSRSAADITGALSHGALMGARGNSGVIFSQVLRGFHRGLAGAERIGSAEWAKGMREAAGAAYQAVLKPVEGTMLTVIREMADAAETAAAKGSTLVEAMSATVEAGRASVARTPTLLAKLREAGVVDAGGQGLFVIFEGMLRHAHGESVEGEALGTGSVLDLAPEGVHVAHGEFGYCTNFIVIGKDLDFPTVREWIAAQGDSAVIVGDEHAIKVHIHTTDPGAILSYVTPLGSVRQVAVTDMQEQAEDFIDMHEQAGTGGAIPAAGGPTGPSSDAAVSGIATVAVVAGKGLADAFRSMGATALVEGGQTMNPSTEDLLKAVEAVPQQEVILLPNNGNIVMAAKQTQSLSNKRVVVVPTDTLPQGMAALVAFNYEADLETNAAAMQEAADAVETGEITTAVRDVTLDDVRVKVGDVIGLHNGKLVLCGESNDAVAEQLLERMGAADRDLITIYYGQDVTAEQAEAFCAAVQQRYANQEVEAVAGGQPFYAYIISVE